MAALKMFTPVQVRKYSRIMIAAEIPSGAAWAGIGLPFMTGYLLLLGASSFQISMLSSLPALCGLSSLLALVLLRKTRGKKKLALFLFVFFFGCHAAIGAVGFLARGWSPSAKVALCLAVYGCAYAAVRILDIVWFPWISAIVPDGKRGAFFSLLLTVGSLVTMPVSFLIGNFLDARNNESGFFVVLAACGLVGSLLAVFYARIPDVPNEREESTRPILERVREAFGDPGLGPLVVYSLFAAFAANLVGPFTNVFMIERLKVPYNVIALFGIFSTATYVVFMNVWGFVVDKYGSKPVLALCSVPPILVNFLWALNRPGAYALLPFLFVFSGASSAGTVVATNNLLLGVSRGGAGSLPLAVNQVVGGMMGFAAPILGGFVLEASHSVSFSVLGFTVGPYQLLFCLTALASILPLAFTAGLENARRKTAFGVLKSLLLHNPIRLAIDLVGYYASSSEAGKLTAAARLGRTGSPMALGELINLLDDPSYFVRREAALSLGKIRDKDAVLPLVEKLADEFAGIQYEAAWALGKMKDEKSIPPLLESLKASDRRLRSYAAIALGEIGTSVAIEPLLAMLDGSVDVLETTSAVKALSRLGYRKALWKALPKLVESDKPIVRRLLAVSLGDLLGAEGEFYAILTREERVYGDRVTHIVDRISKGVRKNWRRKLPPGAVEETLALLGRIYDLYMEANYIEALRTVTGLSGLLFGFGVHQYNYAQEVGRKFLSELLRQNEARGSVVYWEECLLSIYELNLIFRVTTV